MKILLGLYLLGALAHAEQLDVNGNFTNVHSTDAQCDTIFAITQYEARSFLTNTANSVLDFESPNGSGFFNSMTIVGATDPNGNISGTKNFWQDNLYYRLTLNGIVTTQLLDVNIQIEADSSTQGPALCTAQAEFSGFNLGNNSLPRYEIED